MAGTRKTTAASRAATLVVALALLRAGVACAHGGAFETRSTALGAGTLSVGTVPASKLPMLQTVCQAGVCNYASTLSFLAPETDLPEESLFALREGTLVRIEIVSADLGLSLKFGSTTLDEPGDSTVLGFANAMHAHLSPVASAPAGTIRDWNLTIRLTTRARGYEDSWPIPIVLTNAAETVTTTTTSTTSSTTSTVPPTTCGNGLVDVGEECDPGPDPWALGRACADDCTWIACGDVDGNGTRAASDALFVLGVGVGSQSCDACVCNVDGVGATTNAGDALRLLRFAVGAPDATLNCIACK
jgi:hypothetical protein